METCERLSNVCESAHASEVHQNKDKNVSAGGRRKGHTEARSDRQQD